MHQSSLKDIHIIQIVALETVNEAVEQLPNISQRVYFNVELPGGFVMLRKEVPLVTSLVGYPIKRLLSTKTSEWGFHDNSCS